jgi:glyoxylase-like metal-dependent hydrolase (beta-lactamase superfamily II)
LKIHRIRMPRVNSWLLESGGRWLLIDSGKPRTVDALFRGITAKGCEIGNIALLLITHAHFDHVGGASRLKRETGVPIAIHKNEADLLRTGRFVISDGLNALGRTKVFLGRHVAPRAMFAFEPTVPDIIIEGKSRLDDFGFAASVIHTPGHSPGSISLLTDGGDLFCGDLAITQPLAGIWRHMPIYGSSVEDIKHSWRMSLDMGAKHVYPSHGRDFPSYELAELL